MTISASEEDGIVWCDFVEFPAIGKHRRLPEGLDPSATRHPLARPGSINLRLHRVQKGFESCDAFEIESYLALANAHQVIMRVGHSRHHGVAVKVNRSSALALVS